MANPGFPRPRGHQPMSLGQKPIIWQDFCWKLHENERNWTEKGARTPSEWGCVAARDASPLSPNSFIFMLFFRLTFYEIIAHPSRELALLWEVLDPPLMKELTVYEDNSGPTMPKNLFYVSPTSSNCTLPFPIIPRHNLENVCRIYE